MAGEPKHITSWLREKLPPWLLTLGRKAIPGSVKDYIKSGMGGSAFKGLEERLAQKRQDELRQGSQTVPLSQLESDIRALDLGQDAVLFVHSSLSKLGFVEGGAKSVVQALVEVVVKELQGTLAMPAFSIAGTMYETMLADRVFDLRNSPTNMGSIPETCRHWPGVERSLHPSHSVCALGAKARWLTKDHYTSRKAFGPDSPLAKLLKCRGFVMGLDTDLGPVTFYHVLEDCNDSFPFNVYTPDSPLEVECLDQQGNKVTLSVNAHDPKVSATRIDTKAGLFIRGYITEYLEEHGGLRWHPVGAGRAWLVGATNMYQCLQRLMEQGITIYTTQEELHEVLA